jgi:hypothetical protein
MFVGAYNHIALILERALSNEKVRDMKAKPVIKRKMSMMPEIQGETYVKKRNICSKVISAYSETKHLTRNDSIEDEFHIDHMEGTEDHTCVPY